MNHSDNETNSNGEGNIDAALVDSFFLPGGILDPDYEKEDQPKIQTDHFFNAAAGGIGLPSNPWAPSTASTTVGSHGALSTPLRQQSHLQSSGPPQPDYISLQTQAASLPLQSPLTSSPTYGPLGSQRSSQAMQGTVTDLSIGADLPAILRSMPSNPSLTSQSQQISPPPEPTVIQTLQSNTAQDTPASPLRNREYQRQQPLSDLDPILVASHQRRERPLGLGQTNLGSPPSGHRSPKPIAPPTSSLQEFDLGLSATASAYEPSPITLAALSTTIERAPEPTASTKKPASRSTAQVKTITASTDVCITGKDDQRHEVGEAQEEEEEESIQSIPRELQGPSNAEYVADDVSSTSSLSTSTCEQKQANRRQISARSHRTEREATASPEDVEETEEEDEEDTTPEAESPSVRELSIEKPQQHSLPSLESNKVQQLDRSLPHEEAPVTERQASSPAKRKTKTRRLRHGNYKRNPNMDDDQPKSTTTAKTQRIRNSTEKQLLPRKTMLDAVSSWFASTASAIFDGCTRLRIRIAWVEQIIFGFMRQVSFILWRYVATTLSISVLFISGMALDTREYWEVWFTYGLFYIYPKAILQLSMFIDVPHWMPQVSIYLILWQCCSTDFCSFIETVENPVEKTVGSTTNSLYNNEDVVSRKDGTSKESSNPAGYETKSNRLSRTKETTRNVTQAKSWRRSVERRAQTRRTSLFIVRLLLLYLFFYDGFSTELGPIMALPCRYRLVCSFLLLMCHMDLHSSVLWSAFGTQFVLASEIDLNATVLDGWIVSGLLDFVVLAVGLSAIHLKSLIDSETLMQQASSLHAKSE